MDAFVGENETATTVFSYVLIAFVVVLVAITLVSAGKSMKLRWSKRLPAAPVPAGASKCRRVYSWLAPVRIPRAESLYGSDNRRASFVVKNPLALRQLQELAFSIRDEARTSGGEEPADKLVPLSVAAPLPRDVVSERVASKRLPEGWTAVEDDDGDRCAGAGDVFDVWVTVFTPDTM